MTVGAAVNGTSVSVAMDMTEGIIARFRTMAIFRPSVLTGHVLGSLIQTLLSVACGGRHRAAGRVPPGRRRRRVARRARDDRRCSPSR